MGKTEAFKSAGFYLAGGTGLALQLGHRKSDDLGFFTEQTFDSFIVNKIADVLPVQIQYISETTVYLLSNNVKISLFFYPYKVVFPFLQFEGCLVADLRDIAAMKFIAIGQRGAKRDFVDLYFYFLKYPEVSELLKIVQLKYSKVSYNLIHLVKNLGYFDDVEEDPMPVLVTKNGFKSMTTKQWNEIKEFFLNLQKKILADLSIE
ncbi:nucleotidyl transferase AbiEii/AbiGii toxin family protein [Pseudothermotoga thermarum]|uniref:Nucleotidyl transferase AbiEii toxin, Type IV TA system n=1 Tax=Pseudothermotoga thermarum DSM 5069 TaxID=688269 RepID=F7YXB2_9THEM|nr:nucleotidyl transferase AbiEii/AbiGii toxin family protein [Pseudothermotoga thermarum]AEH51489.1 hypothetical protein Theth_1430 [Pseudothermotoga thermarum DSM 5069]